MTVQDMNPIVDIKSVHEKEDMISVEFEGIEGKLFKDFKSGNIFLSSSANSVSVVE